MNDMTPEEWIARLAEGDTSEQGSAWLAANPSAKPRVLALQRIVAGLKTAMTEPPTELTAAAQNLFEERRARRVISWQAALGVRSSAPEAVSATWESGGITRRLRAVRVNDEWEILGQSEAFAGAEIVLGSTETQADSTGRFSVTSPTLPSQIEVFTESGLEQIDLNFEG